VWAWQVEGVVGGRANDIAHFHVAGHGMKSGRKGGGLRAKQHAIV